MTPTDALRLLMFAAQFDPTMLPTNRDAQITKAQAWAEAVPDWINHDTARAAAIAHDWTSRFTPTHVIRHAAQHHSQSPTRRRCNPTVLPPHRPGDAWTVTCAACGWHHDTHHDTHQAADYAAAHHTRQPA